MPPRSLLQFSAANADRATASADSTGAQPYFRIFNPTAQGERFDPGGEYARRWVPELEGPTGKVIHRPWVTPPESRTYPAPIVDHQRERAVAPARCRAARDQSLAPVASRRERLRVSWRAL